MHATLLYIGFLGSFFLGAKFLPGFIRLGQPLKTSSRKSYKLTGLVLFLLTNGLLIVGALFFKLSLSALTSLFWPLFVVANTVSLIVSGILYFQFYCEQTPETQRGKNSFVAGFWFGKELNPSWAGIDLKMFAYQPSLIGLMLVNFSFAYLQFEKYGELSRPMLLFQVFWWIYLASHYYREDFMLSTWDIISEKFGFMLVWGDLVFVPFFYSIAGWYLVDAGEIWPVQVLWGIGFLYLFNLWVFRSANLQKFKFKTDPHAHIWGSPAQALGGKLLVSGWWGIGRKLNYTGEIGVYLAIALTTGFSSFIPYLPVVWLCALLFHRAYRDEKRCEEKYGELWLAYCKKSRFRMVPFIY